MEDYSKSLLIWIFPEIAFVKYRKLHIKLSININLQKGVESMINGIQRANINSTVINGLKMTDFGEADRKKIFLSSRGIKNNFKTC